MSAQRLTAFSSGFEIFTTDANPNAVITPIRTGAIAVQYSGTVTVWQCTALPSTWVDITGTGGGSGWQRVGTVVRLTTLTDTVAMGTATMLGTERLRVVLADAVTNAVSNALVVEHQSSGVPASGFGAGILFVGETSAGAPMSMGQINGFASNVGVGTEAGGLGFQTRSGGGALTQRWTIDAVGNFQPAADNAYSVGSSGLRIASLNANEFSSYLLSGDANPAARLTGALGLALGPGGGTPLDWSLRRSAALGTARAELATGNQLTAWGAGSEFAVRAVNSDANPTLALSSASVAYGAGGGSATDVAIRRVSASQLQLDNGSGAPVNGLSILGRLSTRARTLNRVFRLAAAGAYGVTTEDDFVGMNTTTAGQAVNLPSAASVPEGHRVIIKNTAAVGVLNNLALTPNGTDTIDSVNAVVNLTGTQRVTLISQNSAGVVGWHVI